MKHTVIDEPSCVDRTSRRGQSRRVPAFTLLELLVVISIIGLLASLSLPAIKSINKSNLMVAAGRQLLDDIGLARLTAINERTTVYVVFIPTNIVGVTSVNANEQRQLETLIGGQYTDYALYAPRSVGDQPGNDNSHYLTEWKALPEGVFVAPQKFFTDYSNPDTFSKPLVPLVTAFQYTNFIPYPNSYSVARPNLPYIAFNSLGQLVSGRDEIIPLTRGSIFNPKDTNNVAFLPVPADVVETPSGNYINNFTHIHINWLTGRAKLVRPEF